MAAGLFSAHKNAGKIFGKMGLLRSTMRTGYHLRVIGEKAESLLGMNHQLIAIVALQKKLKVSIFGLYRIQNTSEGSYPEP